MSLAQALAEEERSAQRGRGRGRGGSDRGRGPRAAKKAKLAESPLPKEGAKDTGALPVLLHCKQCCDQAAGYRCRVSPENLTAPIEGNARASDTCFASKQLLKPKMEPRMTRRGARCCGTCSSTRWTARTWASCGRRSHASWSCTTLTSPLCGSWRYGSLGRASEWVTQSSFFKQSQHSGVPTVLVMQG